MATWNDYKNHLRESNPEIGRDFDEVEERAKIVSAIIDQRHNLNIVIHVFRYMAYGYLPYSNYCKVLKSA